MDRAAIHEVAIAIMPQVAWGLCLLIAGLGLLVAVATRRLIILHVFGTISIFLWVAITVSALLSDAFDDNINLTGIALGLFIWMLLGPLAMLLAPLMAERSDSKEVK